MGAIRLIYSTRSALAAPPAIGVTVVAPCGWIGNLEKELTTQWQAEKDKLAAGQHLKEQIDAARLELEQVQREGNLARAGELSYGVIPDLEKQLEGAEEAAEGHMLKESANRHPKP